MEEFKSGGKKDLKGKKPLSMVTMNMMEGIVNGMLLGMEKGYEKHNWKLGLPIVAGHLDATLRHIHKYIDGEDMNLEVHPVTGESLTPTHHLDNALTHLAMAVHQIKEKRIDLDDRF